jgi:predicted O-methyltransferase YrrM
MTARHPAPTVYYQSMRFDPVTFTEAYPRLTMFGRRLLENLTGRLYYFNGQKNRVRVFQAINDQVRFENYVETGTYLGMTTDFLARTAIKRHACVHSCELDSRFFAIARRTVGALENVHLHHTDSVTFLRSLLPQLSGALNFVYLDAHDREHLPLRAELDILQGCRDTVVMIDDFKVPFDERFGWDKYDNEQEICLQHIEGVVDVNDVYMPSYPAPHEAATYRGEMSPRGYCVIAMSKDLRKVLDGISLLRKL